jgi:hypothetical protein
VIVSHEHQLIFLKTKKTAGTSVEIALSQFCGPDDVITRIFAEDEAVRRELGFRGPQNDELPRALCSHGDLARTLLLRRAAPRIANHTDARTARRIVGEDVWRRYFKFTFERNPYDKAVSRYFWSTRKAAERPPLADYLAQEDPRQISNWWIYTIDGEIAVDFVGRTENLAADLREALGRAGVRAEPTLPRTKSRFRADRRHYSQLLDARARGIVEALCARELAAFGYVWEDSA